LISRIKLKIGNSPCSPLKHVRGEAEINNTESCIIFHKINSKWIIGQNVEHKTIKILEMKPRDNVMTWFSNDFLGRTPKIYSAEEICT
jgi:hypothetical protein